MDYLCAKFGDFRFSRFGYIVRTDRQNDGRGRTLMIAILIGTVGVSNNNNNNNNNKLEDCIRFDSLRVLTTCLTLTF